MQLIKAAAADQTVISAINPPEQSPRPVQNATTILQSLGYNESSIKSLTPDMIAKIFLSQGNQDMNKSYQQINEDLFGNASGPSIFSNRTNNNLNPDTARSGKACLIVAITDYRYQHAISYSKPAYDAIFYDASHAGYNNVVTLTNSSATHDAIWEWLSVLCQNYNQVDVYLIGHGCDNGLGLYGYVTWDSDMPGGLVNPLLEYYADEMVSYYVHPYDFSGLFCI
jgi:hypothetical protein